MTGTSPTSCFHGHFSQQYVVLGAAVVFAILLVCPLTAGDKLGLPCEENGVFACHESDPNAFMRCIENELHVFRCPVGLHFSRRSLTCDWPKNADCGGEGENSVAARDKHVNSESGAAANNAGEQTSGNRAVEFGGDGQLLKNDSHPTKPNATVQTEENTAVEIGGDGQVKKNDSHPTQPNASGYTGGNSTVEAGGGGQVPKNDSHSAKPKASVYTSGNSTVEVGGGGQVKKNDSHSAKPKASVYTSANSTVEIGGDGQVKNGSHHIKHHRVMNDASDGSDWKNRDDSDSGEGEDSDSSSYQAKSKKPWWRPANVNPKHWEDVNSLVEVSYDGSYSEAASSSGKKRRRGKGKRGKRDDEDGDYYEYEDDWESEEDQEGHSHKFSSFGDIDSFQDGAERSEPCNPSECRLPSCRCPGTDIPDGLSPSSTPQMVMITFDDEVSEAYFGYFKRLFRSGRRNPNGCRVRGCLFVSGSGTDYNLVHPLYSMGMEIASHTLSHKFPHTWWATATYQEYVDEVEGMREALSLEAEIPYEDIKGFRVPFLQVGADSMYKALHDQEFLFDSSMFTGAVFEGRDPAWPFTLDYTVPETYCQHGPCPVKTYPGLWEIPVQRWYGTDGNTCAMPDGCSESDDAEDDLDFLRSNFKRYYESNRAPFGIFVHARWFHTGQHLEALDRFIDELLKIEDVYIVTPSQVIEWIKNPTPVEELSYFEPWSCEGSK